MPLLFVVHYHMVCCVFILYAKPNAKSSYVGKETWTTKIPEEIRTFLINYKYCMITFNLI